MGHCVQGGGVFDPGTPRSTLISNNCDKLLDIEQRPLRLE
jgi:hypothetical protein